MLPAEVKLGRGCERQLAAKNYMSRCSYSKDCLAGDRND